LADCDICPLCRSLKRLSEQELEYQLDIWEMEKFTQVNLIFAYYKYKMTQFLCDRLTALEYADWLLNPNWDDYYTHALDNYNVYEIDYSSTSDDDDFG
jgi:hypothetical protein